MSRYQPYPYGAMGRRTQPRHGSKPNWPALVKTLAIAAVVMLAGVGFPR